MGNSISNRGCRCARLCALFGIILTAVGLSGTALADSSVTPTTSSPATSSSTTSAKPNTTQSKTTSASSASASSGASSSGSATTHASTTHSSSSHSSAHKTTSKSASHKSTGQKTTASRGKKSSTNQRSSRKRGQQAIDRDRARAIQEALIREHYLQGAPSGTWDATTQAAMQRYQADQGWQSKTTPESRALIKLGLGPSNDHLLNPESAMTAAPAAGDPKAATKPGPTQNNLPHQ
jgi:hypothetical protein